MNKVSIRKEGHTTYIELNDALKKNALDLEMAEQLLISFQQADRDATCEVIVFASTGRAYFSSGPDVRGLIEVAETAGGQQVLDQVVATLNQLILVIYHSSKITVAAIHGYAYGGGLNIMLACDYRIAEKKAKFIENFLYMGVTPDLSASYFLPRLIGPARTMELLLSGRLFTAEEAAEWGLFNEVIEKRSEMMNRVQALSEQWSSGDLSTIARMKQLLRQSASSSLEQHLALEKQYLVDCFSNPAIAERLKKLVEPNPVPVTVM